MSKAPSPLMWTVFLAMLLTSGAGVAASSDCPLAVIRR